MTLTPQHCVNNAALLGEHRMPMVLISLPPNSLVQLHNGDPYPQHTVQQEHLITT